MTAVPSERNGADPDAEVRTGLAYAFTAFGLWGFAPLFWKYVSFISPFEVLAHRIVWSVLFISGLMMRGGRARALFSALKGPKVLMGLALSTVLISINWVTFIWAVGQDRVLEVSLGYFLNPLVNVALGFLVLKERLNRAQTVAVGLAVLAAGILTLGINGLPWLPLLLGISFGLYGLVRKLVPVGGLEGLFAETLAVLPICLIYLVWLETQGAGVFLSGSPSTDLLLVLAGPMTFVPLLFFAMAARRIKLTTLGLIQYLAPSMHFLLAVFVFGEPLTLAHLASFGLIWTGLAVYTADSVRRERRIRRGLPV